jgi:hypothetical protein
MSSTVGSKYVSGQVKATNATLNVLVVGFMPKKAVVSNLTNSIKVESADGLATGQNIKTIADGTRSVLASGGIEATKDSNGNCGIKIPVLADVNDTTTEILLWEAWG